MPIRYDRDGSICAHPSARSEALVTPNQSRWVGSDQVGRSQGSLPLSVGPSPRFPSHRLTFLLFMRFLRFLSRPAFGAPRLSRQNRRASLAFSAAAIVPVMAPTSSHSVTKPSRREPLPPDLEAHHVKNKHGKTVKYRTQPFLFSRTLFGTDAALCTRATLLVRWTIPPSEAHSPLHPTWVNADTESCREPPRLAPGYGLLGVDEASVVRSQRPRVGVAVSR